MQISADAQSFKALVKSVPSVLRLDDGVTIPLSLDKIGHVRILELAARHPRRPMEALQALFEALVAGTAQDHSGRSRRARRRHRPSPAGSTPATVAAGLLAEAPDLLLMLITESAKRGPGVRPPARPSTISSLRSARPTPTHWSTCSSIGRKGEDLPGGFGPFVSAGQEARAG